jgi:hypothetical protein
LKHFTLVCKHWKKISENAISVPKLLSFFDTEHYDIGRAVLLVRKYQPTAIKANYMWLPFALGCIVAESKRLDTVIFRWWPLYTPKPVR